jgi:hypothetical protein
MDLNVQLTITAQIEWLVGAFLLRTIATGEPPLKPDTRSIGEPPVKSVYFDMLQETIASFSTSL